MYSFNLTHSRPKTTWPRMSWIGRWWAALSCKSAPAVGSARTSRAKSKAALRKDDPQSHRQRDRDYEFYGRHLMANYMGCDAAALSNHAGLRAALESAIKAAGATLLDSVDFKFTPGGMTAVMLLSESHASIHTYPEHHACFVDLFTCGRTCSAERFDEVLTDYLRPQSVQRRTMLRHEDGIEESELAATSDWAADWAA